MLLPNSVYHVYNHANGKENLFNEEKNYFFFIEKYFQHIQPIAETFCWCLMPNHFHLMLRVREEKTIISNLNLNESNLNFQKLQNALSTQFSNLFNSYTKAFNKMYARRGNLFQRPFKVKEVTTDAYFTQLLLYIHNNPVKHGFVKDLFDWPFSTVHYYVSSPKIDDCKNSTGLNTLEVLDWFGGLERFTQAHQNISEMQSVFD